MGKLQKVLLTGLMLATILGSGCRKDTKPTVQKSLVQIARENYTRTDSDSEMIFYSKARAPLAFIARDDNPYAAEQGIDACLGARRLDSSDIRAPALLGIFNFELGKIKEARNWQKILEKLENEQHVTYDSLFADGQELALRMELYLQLDKTDKSEWVAERYAKLRNNFMDNLELKRSFKAEYILFAKYAYKFYDDPDRTYDFETEKHIDALNEIKSRMGEQVPDKIDKAWKMISREIDRYHKEKDRRDRVASREREKRLAKYVPPRSNWDKAGELLDTIRERIANSLDMQNSFDSVVDARWRSFELEKESETGWDCRYNIVQKFIDGNRGYVKCEYEFFDKFGDRMPNKNSEYTVKEVYWYNQRTRHWSR